MTDDRCPISRFPIPKVGRSPPNLPMIFYLASGNAHKVAELQSLADSSAVPVAIRSARDVGGMPAVEEDTGTFIGNARKKAAALRPLLPAGTWALADDSGVCVAELGGAPGVESAYFAGPQHDAAANLAKLIEVMRGVPDARRRAQFRCVLVALGPQGEEHVFEGECAGRLLHEPRGGSGFGYDPSFVPDGYTSSYAELGDDVKNTISHRARAWAKLAEWVKSRAGL
jgi:XTP/dITP diphosphohydrolase